MLIAKKKLFTNESPNGCGGGSVFFVNEEDHRYLKNAELREEGGTPAIVETIRLGLVMQLKDQFQNDFIMQREEDLMKRARTKLKNTENVVLLENSEDNKLPILSFLIKHGSTFLHYNFVSALLNDLYGIQSRGGCACAGPYAQKLLGINRNLADEYEKILVEDERLDRRHLRRGHSEYSSFEILR